MNNLKELEEKYEELGKEIERLKKEQETVGFWGDPIFLLSKEEYKRYKDKIPKINCWWWLKSSDIGSNYSTDVVSSDAVYSDGYAVSADNGAVRPALILSPIVVNAVLHNLQIGETFFDRTYKVRCKEKIVFNGVTWVKIDKDLYISELPIDFRRFDNKSNDYETSEVRKFLLHWFEDRMELN